MIYIIAIGSNSASRFGSPIENLRKSIQFIKNRNIQIIKKSSIYLSPPKDFLRAGGIFYNAVLMVNTSLKPISLLRELKKIEQTMGRYKHKKNSSRTCDLDILLHKSQKIINETETDLSCFIPHPEMCNRNFVMLPLAEICPYWIHPLEEMSILSIVKRKFFTDKLYKGTNVL